jgi:hypothetical protein
MALTFNTKDPGYAYRPALSVDKFPKKLGRVCLIFTKPPSNREPVFTVGESSAESELNVLYGSYSLTDAMDEFQRISGYPDARKSAEYEAFKAYCSFHLLGPSK